MVAHPRDPATAGSSPSTAPIVAASCPTAAAAVWRTRDRGRQLGAPRAGLPQEHAYVGVLREAMAVDRLDPVGVYVRDEQRRAVDSADEGASWHQVAGHLPGIWSVEALVLED